MTVWCALSLLREVSIRHYKGQLTKKDVGVEKLCDCGEALDLDLVLVEFLFSC
jgi:hypothetical protein